MEPFATITKYYPFVDGEIQSMLGSLMEESGNYHEFVCRLGKHVLDNDIHPHLAYIAAAQAFWSHATELLVAISKKHRETPYVRIWGLSRGAEWMQSGSDELLHGIESELDRVAEHCDEDWIMAEAYLFYAFHLTYAPIYKTLETIDKVRALIVKDARLGCFDALACAIEGFVRRRELGEIDVLEILQRGLSVARESGDIVHELLALTYLAATRRDSNIVEAGQLFEEAYVLASHTGVPYFLGEVLNSTSMVYEITGELDLAIACQLEGFGVLIDEANDSVPHLVLSRLYAKLGDGKRVFEHVNFASSDPDEEVNPYFHMQRAHALILLNRLEEVEDEIATAYSLLLRHDNEYSLAIYYRICGIYERAKGNLLNALDFLERAFEIQDRLHRSSSALDTLFYLADVELSIKLQSKNRHEAFPSGPWTTKLEIQLGIHKFPGLLMRFALIKADFYQKIGQYLDARQVLSDALELSDSDGVRTFRQRIGEKIIELDQLIEKPSL